jgi:hypothetical protein
VGLVALQLVEHSTGLLAAKHFADGAGVPGAATLGGRDSVAGQAVGNSAKRRTGFALRNDARYPATFNSL